MPPKKRARRDDVATGGVPPPTPPTEVHNGKKGKKEPENRQRLTLSMCYQILIMNFWQKKL